MNKYIKTAIFDADYILYIACNPNKVYENGRATKIDDKYVYTDKTVEQAIATCDSYIKDVLNVTKSDSYILYLTKGKNFRYEVDSSYKANRKGLERPLWFDEVRDHMIKEWGAISCSGLEADDLVVITRNALENSFIVAADKDILDCVPGVHFDARKGRAEFIHVSDKDAEYNFARSMLTGDKIDGIPNLVPGMGPKTAELEINTRVTYNLISPMSAVFNVYVKTLGEKKGIDRFYNQYRLLKIISSENEIPEGIEFTMPEPTCYECVESILSEEFYKLYPDYDL